MKSGEEIRATIDASKTASGSPFGSSASILLDTLPPARLLTRPAAGPHVLRRSASTRLSPPVANAIAACAWPAAQHAQVIPRASTELDRRARASLTIADLT